MMMLTIVKKVFNWYIGLPNPKFETVWFFIVPFALVVGMLLGKFAHKCPEAPYVCRAPVSQSEYKEGEWEKGYNVLADRLEQCGIDMVRTAEDCSSHLICLDISSITY